MNDNLNNWTNLQKEYFNRVWKKHIIHRSQLETLCSQHPQRNSLKLNSFHIKIQNKEKRIIKVSKKINDSQLEKAMEVFFFNSNRN